MAFFFELEECPYIYDKQSFFFNIRTLVQFELILIAILFLLNIAVKKHVPKWKGKAVEKLVKRILSKLDSKSY
ncbi:hypothetical protein bcere0002_46070 [Bacillus cereus ATCC 10876]|nr:hypothetical protein bcere0002_46070 [Bacillus cereus ATCC 10876]MBJ3791166.1 hypothetical protein [Bacillus sp. OA1]